MQESSRRFVTWLYDEDYLVMRKSGDRMNEFFMGRKIQTSEHCDCVLPDRIKQNFERSSSRVRFPTCYFVALERVRLPLRRHCAMNLVLTTFLSMGSDR